MRRMLLTGANRGVGRGLAEQLLRQGQYSLVLATRSAERQEALRVSLGGLATGCAFAHADQQEADFASKITTQLLALGGKFDVLFLNAAAAFKDGQMEAAQRAERLLQVNFKAVTDLTEKCLNAGLVAAGAKIIFVSSELGNFRMLRDAQAKARLLAADRIAQLSEIADEYVAARARGEVWQSRIANAPEYSFSKLLLTLAARIYAKDPRVEASGAAVYAVCPGWTRTEMGGPNAPRSVEESLPALLGLLDLAGPPAAAAGRLLTRGQMVDIAEGYTGPTP